MLTTLTPAERENEASNQGFTSLAEIIGKADVLHYVKQQPSFSEAKPAQPRAPKRRSDAAERAETPRRKKTGGWRTTSYIDHDLWRETRDQLFRIAREGYEPTIFATVRRPAGVTDGEAKKWIKLQISRLGQALERKGHLFLALTVYEKERGGLLHAHALAHVHPDLFHVVARWADYFEPTLKRSRTLQKANEPDVSIHVRRAVESDGFYILKQHQFCGPKEKQARGPFWTPSEPITGSRVSWSKPARTILGGRVLPIVEKSSISTPAHRKTKATLPHVAPIRDPDTHGLFGPLPQAVAPPRLHALSPRQRFKLVLPEQIELPLERLPDAVDLMARLGSTHAEIAAKIGRSRAQTTNILNRQFGASRPVARRVLELALAA